MLALQTAHGMDKIGKWICKNCAGDHVANLTHFLECYKIPDYDIRDLSWEEKGFNRMQILHFGYKQLYHNYLNPSQLT